MKGEPGSIPFYRPSIGPEEEAAVLSVLRSGWLTTGDVTARFEQEFAHYVGARHALALNSATAGLHLTLEALGVTTGSVVVTPSFTFAATAEVARYLGAEVTFVDVEERTGNMDPAALERVLSALARQGRRVSAVIPVHIAGLPCDMQGISAAAARAGAAVVEDAAHAFPVRTQAGFAGTLGTAGVFSFYATKPLTTGEGGMVVTSDDEAARRIRVMRLHGIDRDIWKRYTTPGGSWRYDVVAPGYKYNLTDLASALGRVQLTRADEFLRARRRLAQRYLRGLSHCGFLAMPPDAQEHAWHLFIVRVRPGSIRGGRDALMERLAAAGIGTSVHFIPLHTMSYYRDRYGFSPQDFPVSMGIYETCISLPLFPSLTDGEADRVIQAVMEAGQALEA
jgi:dTDP-4-amino-4,6-dideoxygalactose transaminase